MMLLLFLKFKFLKIEANQPQHINVPITTGVTSTDKTEHESELKHRPFLILLISNSFLSS